MASEVSVQPPPETALRTSGLVKRFEELTAVDGIDLEVKRGECFGLLGPNGAGKTTTVEILEGLTPPTEGTTEIFGTRWGTGKDQALRERLGVHLQDTQLADKLTVREVIRLFRSFYTRGRDPEQLIETLGLTQKRSTRYHKLSGGQKQRVALACALVGDPDILFLDEPTTGLDPQARIAIWEVVEAFRAGGGTTVLTTHYMEEAAQLCDRLAIIDHGKVIAEGSPTELINSLGAEQFIELEPVEAQEPGAFEGLPGIAEVRQRGARTILIQENGTGSLAALLDELQRREISLHSLTTRSPTLDDVFLHLTGRALRDE